MRYVIYFLSFFVLFTAKANTGHRLGGDIYPPENTLYSFQLAIENLQNKSKFRTAEFDVQESKDGYPIVFHDVKNIARVVPENKFNRSVLGRLTKNKDISFEDISISKLYLREIKALRLENDARIPELFEVLDAAVEFGLDKPMQVEIKLLNTDQCRMKTIETVSKYKDKININFLAFQGAYNRSFPDPIRWGAVFQKSKLKIYAPYTKKIPSNVLSSKIPLDAITWQFTNILDEKVSVINEATRVIEFPISITGKKGKDYALNIGIRHASDDVGDKGLEVHLNDDKSNKLISFFSKEKGWYWEMIEISDLERFILSVHDKDTSFTGKYPGNKAQVKVNLVEK